MPHISWPLRFVLPHHAGLRPAWMLRLGLFIYDHLGGRKILPPTRTLDLRARPGGAPLRPELPQGVRVFRLLGRRRAAGGADRPRRGRARGGDPDADPLRAGDARRRRLAGRAREADGGGARSPRGRWSTPPGRGSGEVVPRRLRVADRPGGAAGARQPHRDAAAVRARPGLHLPAAGRAHRLRHPLRGRLHADRHHRRRARGSAGRRRSARRRSATTCSRRSPATSRRPVAAEDIVWSYSGVRPLYDDGASSATAATRDYVLEVAATRADGRRCSTSSAARSPPTGGSPRRRWRSSRRTFPACAAAWTAGAPLPGGDFPWDGAPALAARARGRAPVSRPPATRRGWCGSTAPSRARCSTAPGSRPTSAGDFGGGLTEREVVWLRDREWARTAEDVLWRRTKLGLRIGPAGVARVEAFMEGAPGGAVAVGFGAAAPG